MRITTGETEKDLAPRWHGIGGGSLLKAEKDGEVMFLLCTNDPTSAIDYWILVNIETGEHVAYPGIHIPKANTSTTRDLIEGLEKMEREEGYKFYECGTRTHVIVYEREDGE